MKGHIRVGKGEKVLYLTLTPSRRYFERPIQLKAPPNLYSQASSTFYTSIFTRANEQMEHWGAHSNLRAFKHRTLVLGQKWARKIPGGSGL